MRDRKKGMWERWSKRRRSLRRVCVWPRRTLAFVACDSIYSIFSSFSWLSAELLPFVMTEKEGALHERGVTHALLRNRKTSVLRREISFSLPFLLFPFTPRRPSSISLSPHACNPQTNSLGLAVSLPTSRFSPFSYSPPVCDDGRKIDVYIETPLGSRREEEVIYSFSALHLWSSRVLHVAS